MRSGKPRLAAMLLRCCSKAHPDRQFPILSDAAERAAVDLGPSSGATSCTYYGLDDRKINK
jgi:hypothetical protein